jgi:hypothetical protein
VVLALTLRPPDCNGIAQVTQTTMVVALQLLLTFRGKRARLDDFFSIFFFFSYCFVLTKKTHRGTYFRRAIKLYGRGEQFKYILSFPIFFFFRSLFPSPTTIKYVYLFVYRVRYNELFLYNCRHTVLAAVFRRTRRIYFIIPASRKSVHSNQLKCMNVQRHKDCNKGKPFKWRMRFLERELKCTKNK